MNHIEQNRIVERNRLLDAIKERLAHDPRVVAAWLFGSIGRGENDAWSDLDLFVVVNDESFKEIVSSRHQAVSSVGNLVLTEESPLNGPPCGTYFMAGYDFPSGIQLVDWYWQPLSAARKPPIASFLVKRVELSEAPPLEAPPYTDWHPTAEQDALNAASLAGAMLAIQGKYLIRFPDEDLRFHGFIESLLSHATGQPSQYGAASELGSVAEKLDRLDAIVADLSERGPRETSRAAASVKKFLATVRAHVQTMDARPSSGI